MKKPCCEKQGLGWESVRVFPRVWRQPTATLRFDKNKFSGSPNKAQSVWVYRYAGKLLLWQWEPVANVEILVRSYSATPYV